MLLALQSIWLLLCGIEEPNKSLTLICDISRNQDHSETSTQSKVSELQYQFCVRLVEVLHLRHARPNTQASQQARGTEGRGRVRLRPVRLRRLLQHPGKYLSDGFHLDIRFEETSPLREISQWWRKFLF